MLAIFQAAHFLGVSCPTLGRWDHKQILPTFRTVGNHRRYSRQQLIAFITGNNESIMDSPQFGISYLYARVPTYKQKKDGNLKRQIDHLEKIHADRYGTNEPYKIIQDYGSGLNSKRRGFFSKFIKNIRIGIV